MPIVRKRICIGTYAVIDFDYKVTNSSPLTHKLTSKRLYFNYFKEQLDHFNGTAMIKNIMYIFSKTATNVHYFSKLNNIKNIFNPFFATFRPTPSIFT